MIRAIGKSGARSAGPSGWWVPGWRGGACGTGRSAEMLYQALRNLLFAQRETGAFDHPTPPAGVPATLAARCPRSPQHDCGRASLAATEGPAQGRRARSAHRRVRGSPAPVRRSDASYAGRLGDRLVSCRTAAQDALVEHDAIGLPARRTPSRQLGQAAAPARSAPGTPSVRASVRWGANGRPSGGQPSGASCRSRRRARSASCAAPSPMPIHRTRAGADVGKGAAAGQDDAERRHSSRGRGERRRERRLPLVGRGAEEAQGQVQAVDANPARLAECPLVDRGAGHGLHQLADDDANRRRPPEPRRRDGSCRVGRRPGARTSGVRSAREPPRGPPPPEGLRSQLIGRPPSLVVEALLDELLLDGPAVRDRSTSTRSASRTRGRCCPGRRGSSRP